jgi:hypothetical protein
MNTMCGTPFICPLDGQRNQALDFLGRVPGPLRDHFDQRRRKVRVGIHGHALKRERAGDEHQHGQHQDQESLASAN